MVRIHSGSLKNKNMINRQNAIDEIIENFDWGKVHKTMEFLDWKWATTDNEVPTIGQLVNSSHRLLLEAYEGALREKMDFSIATGGFRAKALVNEEKEIFELQLAFELTSWEYYETNF